jgi:hypothetical protein
MPYIFSTRYEYKEDNYQIDLRNAIYKFPFLSNKVIIGEILAANIENKVTFLRALFKCKVVKVEQYDWVGVISEPNPLKEKGIPPCELCVALYKYEETRNEKKRELPIMENEIIKGSISHTFDEIIKKISKEEEIRIILETTTFHPKIKKLAETLRDAYISFEEERYAHTKTSCRKILENLRNKSKDWKKIDNSESICEKFKNTLNSMYSFASPGGPHEGLVTRDETELILKVVAGMFFYVNTLLKNDRITV